MQSQGKDGPQTLHKKTPWEAHEETQWTGPKGKEEPKLQGQGKSKGGARAGPKHGQGRDKAWARAKKSTGIIIW